MRRYHLTTPEILHRLFFPGVGLNAVRKVTSRLIRERRISPASLFEQRKYFVLTPREAERLGEHRSIGRKFEYQGLVNAFGLLSFCAASGLQKFTPREFAEHFPELVIPGVRSGNYYLEIERGPEGEKARLGFIHVDYGVSTQALMKKVRKIISRGFTKPKFAELIQKGNFVIAILAPTEAKVEDIKAALIEERTGFVRFRVEAVPDLGELLARRGRLRDNGRKTGAIASKDVTPPELTPAGDVTPSPTTEVTA